MDAPAVPGGTGGEPTGQKGPSRGVRIQKAALGILVVSLLVAVGLAASQGSRVSTLERTLTQICEESWVGLGATLHSMGEAVRARDYPAYLERESKFAAYKNPLGKCPLTRDESRLVSETSRVVSFGTDVLTGLWQDSPALDTLEVGLRDIGNFIGRLPDPRIQEGLARTLELIVDLESFGYQL